MKTIRSTPGSSSRTAAPSVCSRSRHSSFETLLLNRMMNDTPEYDHKTYFNTHHHQYWAWYPVWDRRMIRSKTLWCTMITTGTWWYNSILRYLESLLFRVCAASKPWRCLVTKHTSTNHCQASCKSCNARPRPNPFFQFVDLSAVHNLAV